MRTSTVRLDLMRGRLVFSALVVGVLLACPMIAASMNGSVEVPILLYHRFGPVATDGMTVSAAVFESQLKYLQGHGYKVIPLRQLLANRLGKTPPPAPRWVAITVDDGHRSVYTDMFPLIRQYRIPVTLFIYPSAISKAAYALTWEQLREMLGTGLFEIQSHSYWHPNFKEEKKRLAPAEFTSFVEMQLRKSKETLEQNLKTRVDMLAWPFGIYSDELIRYAAAAGYQAAFTIERRHVSDTENPMALPRYLVTDRDRGKAFEKLLRGTEER